MALSAIEDRYLSTLTEREFPTFTPEQSAMAAPEGVDSVQLAAGPSATVSDAGSGMPEIRPTPRNKVMGGVADFVRGVRDLANQYEIKDFVPLLGGMGVGDLLLGKSPEELEEWAYGNAPMRIPEMSNVPIVKTGRKEQLADTVFLGVDAAGLGKGAGVAGKAAAKNLGPKAAEMAETMLQKQGLMPGVMPDGKTMPANPQAAVSDLGFFSAVEQAALNVQRKSGTGQAFLNDIAKGENVKADEIKWIGLDDFLNGKKNVTRDEVQQFIAQNKVEVQEVTLGGTDNSFTDPNKAIAYIAEREGWTPAEVVDNWGYEDSRDYIALANDMAQQDPVNGALPAKFGQYTLPGGENYREILLTMPDNTDPQKARLAFEQRMQQKYGSFNTMKFTDAEKAESESTMQAILDNDGVVSKGQVFESSHWDQKNVLAHIRVNDRVDADGKKMLLIEEVQSDWHQAGRDKGYKNDAALEKQFADLTQQHREIVARRADIVVDPDKADEYKALAEQEQQLINQMNKLHDTKQYGVPDAPMKDTWYQLALKRALKYAADNGYERVGITTGARQAERYNLSSQVNQIVVTPRMDAATGEQTRSVAVDLKTAGILQLGVNKNGIVDNARGGFDNPAQFKGKPLADIVGKEMAKKIMDSERATFEGAGLNIGGEGMKKYYDEVYPKFLEKYGKKWGAKVGETSVNIGTEDKMVSKLRERGYDPETVTLQEILSDNNGRTPGWLTEDDVLMLELGVELTSKGVQKEPIRFVDITPEMRQSVSKGQPLFTAAPIGAGTAATMQDEENQ